MLDLNTIKAEIKDTLIDLNYELIQDNSDERKEEIERIVDLLSEV